MIIKDSIKSDGFDKNMKMSEKASRHRQKTIVIKKNREIYKVETNEDKKDHHINDNDTTKTIEDPERTNEFS